MEQISDKEYNTTLKKIKGKEKKAITIALISSIIPFVFGIIWIGFTYNKVNKLNNQSDILSQQIQEKQFKLDSITKLRDEIQLEYLKAKGFNNEKNGTQFKEAVSADSKLKLLQSQGEIDNKIRIQYYRKTLDQDKVWLSIKELGYIHLEDIQSRVGMDDIETNCIAYGKDVSVYDLKLILLTLLRAGIDIQQIMPFKNQTNKEKLIQIIGIKYKDGTDFNKSPISIEEILKANTINDLNW